jgi:uncharacterized Fe-S cluster protein YjdI
MDQNKLIKKYTNGEITIVWKPGICTHSTKCWKGDQGLPEVFDPRLKPWISPEGASSERIMEQIDRCPSGALTYLRNEE